MLPLILGIGAAALLLGRKAVKRATRSNPRKRRAAKRRRNPVESRFRRAGVNVIEARRYLDGKIKVRYSDGKSKTFRKARASRNPATPYEQSQRARIGDYLPLARAIVAKFKESLIYARPPAREVFKQNVAQMVTEEMGDAQSGTALHVAKIAAAQAMREVLEDAQRRGMKVNPARRRGKWTSPGSAAARLAWWRWHHNPAEKDSRGRSLLPECPFRLEPNANLGGYEVIMSMAPEKGKTLAEWARSPQDAALIGWRRAQHLCRQGYGGPRLAARIERVLGDLKAQYPSQTNPRRRRKARRK